MAITQTRWKWKLLLDSSGLDLDLLDGVTANHSHLKVEAMGYLE
jgi:hypothetical protein